FPSLHRWYVTPGQESQPETHMGTTYSPQSARKCLSCHAIPAPDSAAQLEPRFQGVGCESCHGPGSRHIEAMRGGIRTSTGIERLSEPAAQIAACSRCHRAEQDI